MLKIICTFVLMNELKALENKTVLFLYLLKTCTNTNEVDISYNILNEAFGYCFSTCKAYLNELEKLGLVEIRFKNGYYTKVIFKVTIDIPCFLFLDSLDRSSKSILLQIYLNKQEFDNYKLDADKHTLLRISISTWKTFKKTLKELDRSLDSLFELEINLIPLNYSNTIIDTNGYMRSTGISTKVRGRPTSAYKCLTCGEEDEVCFSGTSKASCRDCELKKYRDRYHQKKSNLKNPTDLLIDTYFGEKLIRVKSKARSRGNGIDVTITKEDLLELYSKQNKVCYYSGLAFNLDGTSKYDNLTLDRLDSSKGYTKDNVVLSLFIYNTMKSDMTCKQFKYYLENIKIENIKC